MITRAVVITIVFVVFIWGIFSASPTSSFIPLPRKISSSSPTGGRSSSSCWHDDVLMTKATPSPLYMVASSPSSSGKKNKTKKKGRAAATKSMGADKNQQQHQQSKPNGKKLNFQQKKSSRSIPNTQNRPVVTFYDEQRNDDVNRQRLSSTSCPIMDCPHFEDCPGCVVDRDIGSVDIIQSARRFFSSTAVRKHRLDVLQQQHQQRHHQHQPSNNNMDWNAPVVVEDEEDSEFYQVVVPSSVSQWRTQAKLVVTNKGSSQWAREGCQLGLYQRGSHNVITIPNCQVHHPNINRAVQVLEAATERVGTVAAASTDNNNGSPDQGGLRYVQFQVERTTGKIQLVLVWSSSELKYAQPGLSRLVKELQKQEPDLWHSIWCHCNDGPGNNIFARNPRNWHRLSGPEFVREPLPVGSLGWMYFSPLCFRQGNMDGFDVIANDVARAVPAGSKVCELYAGVGLLGLTALAYHHNDDDDADPLVWLRCSDENPANPRCFSRSVRSLPQEMTHHPARANDASSSSSTANGGGGGDLTLGEIMQRLRDGQEDQQQFQNNLPTRVGPKTTYMVASAGEALRSGQALGADVLIVDPPRKGLEDDVLDELCKPFNPKQPLVESPDMLTVRDELVHWTNDVKTLVYISCGFDALARDCERLLSSPTGWKLESATGYVLFPGSNHVETLCVFQRK